MERDLTEFPFAGGGEAAFEARVASATVTPPFDLPWRVLMVDRTPGEPVDSDIPADLNPACRLNDVPWIKPGTPSGMLPSRDQRSVRTIVRHRGITFNHPTFGLNNGMRLGQLEQDIAEELGTDRLSSG